MKTTLIATAACLALVAASAQTAQPDTSATVTQAQTPVAGTETPYSVVGKTGNSRQWEKLIYETAISGGVIARRHRYEEWGSGMYFKDDSGAWVESQERIVPLITGGAAGTEAPHKIYFPENVYQGVIELVTPDGLHLKSRPLGISYADGTNNILIAELTNSVGQISGSTIIYTNVMTDIDCDLVLSFRNGSVESDLIFMSKLPPPEAFGMNPDTTRLQLITEFFDSPEPVVKTLAVNPADGLADAILKFGKMQMRPAGKAFSVGPGGQPVQPSQPSGVKIYKSWLHVAGRQMLIEETWYRNVKPQLDELSAVDKPERWLAVSRISNPKIVGDDVRSLTLSKRAKLETPHVVSYTSKEMAMASLRLPPARSVKPGTTPLRAAKADLSAKPGLVMDYVIVNADVELFIAKADSTYLLNHLYAETAILEGGRRRKCRRYNPPG
jgi:hypothetical protein